MISLFLLIFSLFHLDVLCETDGAQELTVRLGNRSKDLTLNCKNYLTKSGYQEKSEPGKSLKKFLARLVDEKFSRFAFLTGFTWFTS